MKHIHLFLVCLLFTSGLSAHEEPAKTMSEVREKQQERGRIEQLGIRSAIAWEYEVIDGASTGMRRRHLVSEYDAAGFLQSLSLYSESGSLETRVVYEYDDNGNMVLDADYSGDDELLQRIEYSNDAAGMVSGSVNFDGDGVDSSFEYRRDPARQTVEFCKYDAHGAVEYRIDYLYTPSLDEGSLSGVRKYDTEGRTLMSVTYARFPSGKVREKAVYTGDGSLMHRFLYQWDERGCRTEITRVLPGEVTEFTRRFACDEDGNIHTVETFDGENRLTARTVYQYRHASGAPVGARWHDKYRFIGDIPAVTLHYDHGVLAGSYPPGRETVEVTMEDVSAFLGHVCLCGAGGYRIAQLAADLLKGEDVAPEKGEFTLISGRDHTVSDVIAHVLGCGRRENPNRSQYVIDKQMETPKREYHYFIAYAPRERAVHIIYRKHVLIGNDLMDRLWKVETGYEENPSSVSREEMDLYRETMEKMVRDVVEDRTVGLFEVRPLKYDEFRSRLERIKQESMGNSY